MTSTRLRLRISFFLMLFVLTAGTAGFMFFEQKEFFDAVYFTIVTIATVGYGDITPATYGGKMISIVLIVGGVGTFMGVFANSAELFFENRELESRKKKISIITGLFFSEAGNRLLEFFLESDTNSRELRSKLRISTDWTEQDFREAVKLAYSHNYSIHLETKTIPALTEFLGSTKEFMLRLLEHPVIIEDGKFTELIQAVFHLREELEGRKNFTNLPDSDIEHISNDMERVYSKIVPSWIKYMCHLKGHYPYLYSFSVRTNPFSADISPVIDS